MIRLFQSRQFLMFLVTGGIAAVVNFASRMVYNVWMEFSVAIILAYITGMVTAFILAKMFVFKGGGQPLHHSAILFVIVNLLAVMQTWLVSMFLAYYFLPELGVTKFTREIAHAVGIIIPVFTSYIGHKRWSFR